jgi:hypothetical protein
MAQRVLIAMTKEKEIYQWSKTDKLNHLLPAIPLTIYNLGTLYLLGINSIYLAGIFVLLWITVNISVAGICSGCPYRGGYCPGVSQLYFAPFLSALISKRKAIAPEKRSFKLNLVLLSLFGSGSYIFAFYWLFVLYWNKNALIVLILLGCLLLHMPLSFFILCPKCSYNEICPMAKVHKQFKKDTDIG